MHSRTLAGWLLAGLAIAHAGPATAADDPALLRVFLSDGSALVSYGEPARIGERVIFSMPTASGPNPPLHLVNLPAARVDWERTDKYAEAARAARYLETQAELDYAALANRMTLALNALNDTADAGRRLEIAQNARKMLAAWPREHFNYRLTEVGQMLSLLDEAIADLRVAAGDGQFDLSLTAIVQPPPVATEPLQPAPTTKEALEHVLLAARIADTAAERTALLDTALVGLDRDADALPAGWVTETRAAVKAEFDSERRLDRSYQALTRRIVLQADTQARAADVRSLLRLAEDVRVADRTLGGKRPEMVEALLGAVEARLDAARRLRLARDRWALRLTEFRAYRTAMRAPLDLLGRMEPALEQIKSLAGNTPESLTLLQSAALQTLSQAGAIAPPEEFRQAHALLVTAVQMASNAARMRQEATLAGDMARAWDASSAAAGALMLGARARTDMQSLLRPPQLR